eukprot:CAMPEP_0195541670 /NCGR_PEP_ID=MMETSP0794_2-20130614/51207_1 /TAXON_ID=515487 /ORGANISM="Stephanopyxis turris, Strain CCMP 815" /LENGTH=143 /DNA_ID=CAMNT_0040675773 /DNA_START=168 /DNA_END=599 /DNA_ORIENTATION=-
MKIDAFLPLLNPTSFAPVTSRSNSAPAYAVFDTAHELRASLSSQQHNSACMRKGTYDNMLVGFFSSSMHESFKNKQYERQRTPRSIINSALYLSNDDDSDDSNELSDNFDAKGLANYLAPYAATLLLSIFVTGAFFRFVLMDY